MVRALALAALATLLLSPGAVAQHYPFVRFTAENGLSGTQVWALGQDRRGLLWIASTWGFQRYDGAAFTTLSTPEGLPSANARSIVEDPRGDLWFGTNDGVARYDGRTVSSMRDLPAAPRGIVWGSAVDRQGRLWFASQFGLVRWDGAAFHAFHRADGLADDYVYAVHVARDGALWVGSRGAGVARCELDAAGGLARCRIFALGDGLGANVVRTFADDDKGRTLVGTRGGGVSVYDHGALRPLELPGHPASNDVYALLVRRSGELVVGYAPGGLLLCHTVDTPQCRLLDERNGLPENQVFSLFEDREGQLWVGTEGGLGLLVRDDIWSYGLEEGLPSPHVYAVASDGAKGVWVGTVGGLVHLEVGTHGEPVATHVWRRRDGLPSEFVWAVLRSRRGDLWAGTDAGLCRVRGVRLDCFGRRDGLPSDYILSLAEAADGSLWVGTTAGVGHLRLAGDGRVVGIDAIAPPLGRGPIGAYAVVVDHEGRVWAASSEALALVDGTRLRTLGAEDELDWRAVRGLGLDREGRLLVGGYGRLARRERAGRGGFRLWEHVAGLRDAMVLTLAEDEQGRLVLGTSRGVLVVDPDALGGQGAVVARLDARSGAAASEVSHSSAFARDAAGRWWFGFKGGLSCVAGGLVPAAEPPPSVAFSRLESGRGRVFMAPFSGVEAGPVGWLGGSLPELPHGDDSLRLEVRAQTLLRRGDLRYEYRVAAGDGSWSDARSEPFRYLTNLSPGLYRLEAKAARSEGAWGAPATITFRVESAWWQTRSFRYGVVALGLAFVVSLVGWRVQRAESRSRELERRIAERTDDLARYAEALAEHLQTVDRSSERARRAEAGRRDLFARTSHELRTPLTAILGFSELLERSLGEGIEGRELRYLKNVRESGELLLRQINNLLDQLKLEAGRMEVHLDEIALGSMLESVVSLMEGYALHRGVRLEVRTDEELPVVRVDVAKLRQVLMNLLSNAVKFSPADETVVVSASSIPREASPWRQPAYEIAIRDRGPGIPPEALETIFEPYRQLERSHATVPGTGLGLPIARQFVELLGGTIEVRSEPGHGSLFRVLLPVDPEPLALGGELSEPGFEPQRSQIVAFDFDRDRFGRLARACEELDVLAIRVEELESLRGMLATLRPRLAVAPFDPAVPQGWPRVRPLIGLARERRVPLTLLPWIGDRAEALSFVGVVAADEQEGEVRRVLRSAGIAPRAVGRRPLVLVAAARETGIRFGNALAAAGCDHFRVEGADASRAAIDDATPDAVAVDVQHALALAGFRARWTASSRAPVWVLVDAGDAEPAVLTRLAERLLEPGAGDEAGALAAVARLAVPAASSELAG